MPKSLIPTAPPETAQDLTAAVTEPQNLAVATLDTAQPLVEVFQPFQVTLDTWKAKAASLTVTNLSQKAEMQQARLARLELKEARVNLEKKRKSLVEHLKARTSKIDATAKLIRDEMETLETKLLASEQFAERHAAQLKAETKLLREKELAPFIDTPILGDLSDLTQAQWASVLSSAALAHQAKIDLTRKAEQEERAKAKAEQERKASEKAAKAAAAAPDKSKLKVFAHVLLNLPHPPLNDQSIQKQLSDRMAQLADWAVNVIDDQPTTLL